MHPYKYVPDRQKWRNSAALLEYEKNEFVLDPKFKLTKTCRIATAGSCFASHVSKALVKSGFNVIYTEPAPSFIEVGTDEYNSYYSYSARYGNIYTINQLKDLIDQAFGHREIIEDFYFDGAHACDLLRPSVISGDYTFEEMRVIRKMHIERVRELLRNIDSFVFTFGLTEAWVNSEYSFTYPVCPGTVGGKYIPQLHQFRNYSFDEVREGLQNPRTNLLAQA